MAINTKDGRSGTEVEFSKVCSTKILVLLLHFIQSGGNVSLLQNLLFYVWNLREIVTKNTKKVLRKLFQGRHSGSGHSEYKH